MGNLSILRKMRNPRATFQLRAHNESVQNEHRCERKLRKASENPWAHIPSWRAVVGLELWIALTDVWEPNIQSSIMNIFYFRES